MELGHKLLNAICCKSIVCNLVQFYLILIHLQAWAYNITYWPESKMLLAESLRMIELYFIVQHVSVMT